MSRPRGSERHVLCGAAVFELLTSADVMWAIGEPSAIGIWGVTGRATWLLEERYRLQVKGKADEGESRRGLEAGRAEEA